MFMKTFKSISDLKLNGTVSISDEVFIVVKDSKPQEIQWPEKNLKNELPRRRAARYH
jgi:hypothetical protein